MPPKKSDLDHSRSLFKRLGLHEGAADAGNLLADDDPLEPPQASIAAALRERFDSLRQPHVFAPGELVTWKTGLKNRGIPAYGYPAVIIDVLETPIRDTEESSGCTYFREPLDVIVGVFVDAGELRGEFLVWHLNSQRLQPWTPEAN